MARMRALLRRAGGDGPLRIGPLVIDRAERRTTTDGRRLELTPREFVLPTYLGREAGRSVPRTELLAKVWEMSFETDSNGGEVHVKNLRDKLGPRARLIETVRGVGYRLAVPERGCATA